jgi:hypothetical protein
MDDFRQRMVEAGFSQKQIEFFEEWKAEMDVRLDEIEELVDEGEEDNDE